MRKIAAGSAVVLAFVLAMVIVVAAVGGFRPAAQAAATDAGSTALPAPTLDIPPATPTPDDTPTTDDEPAAADNAPVAATDPASAVAPASSDNAADNAVDNALAAAPVRTESVVLAGGCFWGVQGVFEHVKGVTRAESGYAGGTASTADYTTVSTGTTGHAEAVKVTYDPAQITFGQILQIFFSVVHDPTELDKQGPDTGSQYRSAIFAQNSVQQLVAEAYVAQLTEESVFPDPIVTDIAVDTTFFPAEDYHQDYLDSNPTNLYIVFYDQPKLFDLEHLYPEFYRAAPVLIGAGA